MIRTILGSVREYKAATFQTIFLAAIEAVFEIVIPFWMSYLIDRGIEAGDMRQVAIFGGLRCFLQRCSVRRAWARRIAAPTRRQDFLRICARICSRGCRHFPSRTSTSFRPRRS